MKKILAFLFLTSLFYFAACPAIFDRSKYKKKKTTQTNTNPTSSHDTKSSLTKSKPSLAKGKTTSFDTSVIEIIKGHMPTPNFSETDPCKKMDESGFPWESPQTDKIVLPKGIIANIPPELHDVSSLSKFSYNAAVSTAFEGMRLVYGSMSEEEANKFTAAWAPIFSYPSQEIIDYLNKLNPLISQFLATRESFMRTINDIQLSFLDLTVADEMEEQEAMDALLSESSVYFVQLAKFDAALKDITKRMEILGNPPNPMEEQCKARNRYEKFFKKLQENDCSSPLIGIWTGYSEGGNDAKYYSKLPIMVVFYEMPMEDPNTGKSKCTVEGIMFGGQKSSMGSYNPVLPFGWTHQMIKKVGRKKKHVEFTVKNEYKQINDYLKKVNPNVNLPLPPNSMDRHIVLDKVLTEDLPPVYKGLGKDYIMQLKEDLKVLRKKSMTDEEKYGPLMVHCSKAIDIIENQLLNRNHFFSTAKDWLEDLPLDVNNRDDAYKRLRIFIKRLEPYIETKEPDTIPIDDSIVKDDLSPEEQARKDAIDHHRSMIKVLQADINYVHKRKAEIRKEMWDSKNKNRLKDYGKQLKELDLRIIGYQSNIQAQRDLIQSRKTGKYVHTRTLFDKYARVSFIENIKKNAKRMDDTRRIAGRIERQIKLLPKENQEKARQLVKKHLTSEAIGSGDIEVANELRNAINKQIVGFAEYDQAMAEIAIKDSEENEYYAKTAIAMIGVGVVGAVSIYQPLAATYGVGSAQAVYGPYLLSSIYGGTTGFVSGGPKEGLTQAVNWSSPYGMMVTQFAEGYQDAGKSKKASTGDQILEGTKRAAVAWAFGKLITGGIQVISKVGIIAKNGIAKIPRIRFGKGNTTLPKLSKAYRIKPRGSKTTMPNSTSGKVGKVDDKVFHAHKYKKAMDNIKTFTKLEQNLVRARRNGTSASQIARLEKELQQHAAELNVDYHAKWILKYKSPPILRRKFDFRVQNNYKKMTPEMISNLEKQGYNMKDVKFRQYRNASSGSSSSMDLDYGPVSKSTGKEPAFFMKNGKKVEVEQFMKDAQNSMNTEYYKIFKINAKVSEMNLVTSKHPEAFSDPKLLKADVNWSKVSDKDFAKIGEVLEVKLDGISSNRQLPNITKLQAKSREASKEIENMLLKKLKHDLGKATGKAKDQIQNDIKYWENMLKSFKQVGTNEPNALEIIKINNKVRMETGGKDMNDVISDLVGKFGG